MKFTPPMSTPAAALLLIAQFGLNGAAAWLQMRCLRSDATAGPLEKVTAWGVIFLGNIAGLGLLLSAGGMLTPAGFLGGHLALLAAMMALRRHAWRLDGRELLELGRECRSALRADPWLAAIVAVVMTLGLLAAVAQPVVYDALA